ncbi:MAG TPA: hypothetical protein VGP63_30325 [Planctomycetaceae bacterium]|jgi:hypothetical protein|nr:hypothetical protein [Planctomycetaceae bacterium]
MAESPSHRFGQIIGELLELMLHQPLRKVADKHGLYLDYKHPRSARDNKSKVTWRDSKGNDHDLDYVLERNGSETKRGIPKAFVETAWRRYTKHSRNKAQEMQGAIGPLAETYRDCHPFLGVVLAGVFTSGSTQQLRSHGFSVLYLPYLSIVEAFKAVSIDARFDEDTSDKEVQGKVEAYQRLSADERLAIVDKLQELHRNDFETFIQSLEVSLGRKIERIIILPLHGTGCEMTSVVDAIAFVEKFAVEQAALPFVRFEVQVRYGNGDKIAGEFSEKGEAIAFLKSLV